MELEFRAYKLGYEMEYFSDLYWFEENMVRENGDMGYQITQSTGLYDKNNKKIYIGDILGIDGEILAAVTYEDGSCQLIIDRSQGRNVLQQERTKRFEVIGNIFENKEYIK